MIAEIISIGDELLIGQVINTNQAFIAEQLNSVGIDVARMTTVGDVESRILDGFSSAWKSNTLVVVTGGLGPTHDDITRLAICKFFETDLIVHAPSLENIRRIFSARGLQLTAINEDQALVPRGCTVIPNPNGTAPGYWFEKEGKTMIVMPGVPYEMKGMMEEFTIPKLRKGHDTSVIVHRTLRTTGIAESHLAEKIGDVNLLFSPESGVTLAFLPSLFGVRLRISVRTQSAEEAAKIISDVEQRVRSTTKRYIYGVENEELEDVLCALLIEREMTLSVAESCTGGLIADRITNVSGSSHYFLKGIVAYSNESKATDLDVEPALIQEYGAVSKEVARAMAQGVRKSSGSTLGLSTTGIAGPTGGTAEKPIGTLWIGYSDPSETIALKFNFGNERRRFKERASQAALDLVRRKLLKIE